MPQALESETQGAYEAGGGHSQPAGQAGIGGPVDSGDPGHMRRKTAPKSCTWDQSESAVFTSGVEPSRILIDSLSLPSEWEGTRDTAINPVATASFPLEMSHPVLCSGYRDPGRNLWKEFTAADRSHSWPQEPGLARLRKACRGPICPCSLAGLLSCKIHLGS